MQATTSYRDFLTAHFPNQPSLITVLLALSQAAISISNQLSEIHLYDDDTAGTRNPHEEIQHAMDRFAEREFLTALDATNYCFAILSEEQQDIIQLSSTASEDARYVIALDPLDGSSNIDVNVAVGSIFGIYNRFESQSPGHPAVVMQDASNQIVAGYFLYGAANMLVIASNNQVNGFTVNNVTNEFRLSHPNICIPKTGNIYSVNDGNYHEFERGTQNYLRFCRQQKEFYEQTFTARYIGSMVADVHRTLLRGGIFLYPGTTNSPNGKLRLAYECRPMAAIMETAGGLANSGTRKVLDLELESPHQRIPIVMGSADMVETAQCFLNSSLPATCE